MTTTTNTPPTHAAPAASTSERQLIWNDILGMGLLHLKAVARGGPDSERSWQALQQALAALKRGVR